MTYTMVDLACGSVTYMQKSRNLPMATARTKEARLNFRLPSDLKEVIEEAATAMGQSVSDYAIATLVKSSQTVLQQSQTTVVSSRDRKSFMALLDNLDAKPNRALRAAAHRYKRRIRRNGKV
jgi:uncharacterized protein (DUF1778 family)